MLFRSVQTNATASNLGAGSYTCTITDANGCSTTVSATITAPPGSLNASISSTADVLCFGNNTGSATANITGGTLPYTINWNTSPLQSTATAINLGAGTWTCTIVDNNGCSAMVSAVINEPAAALNVSISASSDVNCFGDATGDATINITGGTPNYGIVWNTVPAQNTTTASNLSAGNYTATITDANGCNAITSVQIDQPVAPLVANISAQTNVACGGNTGDATVNANGGTLPYSYSWNTVPSKTTATVTGLHAGVYKLIVTDSKSCTKKATYTIIEPVAKITGQTNCKEIKLNS